MKFHRKSIRISAILAVVSLAAGAAFFCVAKAQGQGAAQCSKHRRCSTSANLKNYV